ncbi:MAG: mevalonate kinase [Microgenomates group bacterium]
MNNQKIIFSAPAKVIFSGEHAVVYGKPALVCALNKRLKFILFSSLDKKSAATEEILFIAEKVKKYLKDKKIDFFDKPFNFKIESEIPIGRGLGSSAALSVASASCFLKFFASKKFDKKIINDLAFEIEKYFHTHPSGVDNTTSCFGGLIYYRKEFDFLKNISPLPFKIPKKIQDNLFLIDSGKPKETTKEMVEMVKTKLINKPNYVEQILNDVEKITKKMTMALINGDVKNFTQCIIDNEIYLEMLGVVSLKTKNLLKKLEQFGIGKITGAGGIKENSGFILFYSEKQKELENFLKKEKINYFKLIPDYQGLKYESNS